MNQKIRQETFERIFKENLKIETYSKSIDSLFSPRLRSKINYKPAYQRNYVWDEYKATYFIESILLGTEIPPLIFFANNSEIEIIDGRQRFETILRFIQSQFPLRLKGLSLLKQLKNSTYDDLVKNDREIIEKFTDAKLRIIEFRLVNEPPLDKYLEDRIKKEIFSRYNSGITPLKKSEIDNAIYDEDALSNLFKDFFESNLSVSRNVWQTFFKTTLAAEEDPSIENIMTFVRRNLILPMIPISYYARGTGRTDLLTKFYDKFTDDHQDEEEDVLQLFLKKLTFIEHVNSVSEQNNRKNNRLALECFLWALGVLELEELEFEMNVQLAEEISIYINDNIESYTEVDYGFNKQVILRYSKTAEFIANKYNFSADLYVRSNENSLLEIKEVLKPGDTITKLSELETLRLNKPEPSRISIDDITRQLTKRKFLVRPSYQRKEVINPSKASSIIESVILGITLPAIFIYKKTDGVSEVIDGQQRLLTLLGFIGAEYVDEKGSLTTSKNHKFYLRKLRILKNESDNLEGKKFDQLSEFVKNKIYDFQLYVVEIDQKQNPHFDPIDLFLRLNDKPFPIREHSFEMWNSWVDVDIIDGIKSLKSEIDSWFYLKQLSSASDRDRMENEELLMSLTYLEYVNVSKESRQALETYQKNERLNSRISNKASISSLLQDITENEGPKKEQFQIALKNVKSFVRKLKYILLDCDKTRDELFQYLREELDLLFKADKNQKYFRRTMQDFYFLHTLVSDINLEMVKFKRLEIKKELRIIFNYWKNIPEPDRIENKGYVKYKQMESTFKEKYRVDSRKITLSEKEKAELLQTQGGLSNISGTMIFQGDEIEVDHAVPLALGGKDDKSNMQIVHKDENREKGAKLK